MMELLSDDMLIDTYFAAIEYKLEPDFIRMLAVEVKRRGVDLAAAHAHRRHTA
ncbi:MAG: sporulation inhibitor [Paenibacillus sp.]|jgi:developmental checkpoint coupling sporulation initiation to replication initiation|nr:sporulation inhibitor [Paenibacillus sp.]